MKLLTIYFYLSIIFIIGLKFVHTKRTVNFVMDGYTVMDEAFRILLDEFNKYAEQCNSDIELQMTYFSDSIDTVGYNDYSKTLSLIGKKNNRYDIFAYDVQYVKVYSSYLLELDKYLPKNFTDKYSSSKISKKLIYNSDGHISGIPLILIISVFFSNKNYLQKYDKPIPKTWDQLIETTEFILDQEKKMGNELNGYAALFPPNSENTLNAFFQFLYSFRDNINDPLPDYTSKNARDAMKKLIEVRDRASSKDLFQLQENIIVDQMISEKILFSHFYSSLQLDTYTTSSLPGKKEGISASVMGGLNIGIGKYISEERRDAALEAIQLLGSKQFQKECIVKLLGYVTPLDELYDDPEVCEKIPCKMIQEGQYYYRPQESINYYTIFSNRAKENIQSLIEGKIDVEDFVTKIDDITRIYYLDKQSTLGAIIYIFLVFLSCTVVITTCFIFIPNFESHFKFLSKDLWFIYSLGIALLLINSFVYFGIPTEKTCLVRQQLTANGYAIIFIPLVYKLIINFPLINKFSIFATHNKYIFLFGLYFIELLFSILSFIFTTFNIKEVNMTKESKNFYICDKDNTEGKFLEVIQVTYESILYIVICILMFFEWNMTTTYFDIRQFSVVIIIDGITIILFSLFKFINLNNYMLYNMLFIFINIISVVTNHTYIFVVRTIISFYNDKYNNSEDKMMSNMIQNNKYGNCQNNNNSNNTGSICKTRPISTIGDSVVKQSARNQLINIHYAKVAQESFSSDQRSNTNSIINSSSSHNNSQIV